MSGWQWLPPVALLAAASVVVWASVRLRRKQPRSQLLENLLAVARATGEEPTLDATLRRTLELISSLTGADGASLFLMDDRGAVRHQVVSRHEARVEYPRAATQQIMTHGLGGWVARHREAVLLDDAPKDPRWTVIPGEPTWRSVISASIAAGDRLVGILTLVHPKPGIFTQDHLILVRAAVQQMALTLANAQILETRRRIAQRQELLYGVLREVGGRLDAAGLSRVAVHYIAERTNWSHVIVALPHPDGTRWTFEASTKPPFLIDSMPLAAGVIGRAHREGRTQIVEDVTADSDYVDAKGGSRSEVAVPIRSGQRALGVFDIESTERSAFGPDDVALAESLADALALALETARLYGELAAKHDKLREAERMRDDLTHSLVHDLKNPLTTISAVVEGLDMGLGAQARQEHHLLEVAQRSVRKMALLLDAILDVSRLESGQMPLVQDRLRMSTLLEDIVRLQEPLAAAKGVTLEAELDQDTPHAWADAALTGRVLQNLVGNAVKFTGRGGRVHLRARHSQGEVHVVVQDTGPGIAPEIRDRLFQKFAAAGPDQGTGLGLAFCRLAIEAQGGRIWLLSATEGGTAIAFTLPTAAA